MTDKSSEFFEGTEMPTAGWWQALWHNPASVFAAVDLAHRMEVVDLCCGDRCFHAASRERAFRIGDEDAFRFMLTDVPPPPPQAAEVRAINAGMAPASVAQ